MTHDVSGETKLDKIRQNKIKNAPPVIIEHFLAPSVKWIKLEGKNNFQKNEFTEPRLSFLFHQLLKRLACKPLTFYVMKERRYSRFEHMS